MLRKIVICAALFFATVNAFAGNFGYKETPNFRPCCTAPSLAPPCQCPNAFIPAPYVGIGVGGGNIYTNNQAIFRGVDGTITLGIGGVIAPSFYLAGEIFGQYIANVSDYRIPIDLEGRLRGVRSKWSYGVSILPGVVLTDRLITYLRIGGVRTNFMNQNNWKSGGQAGIGFETALTPWVDLRAEYIYSLYRNINPIGNPRSDQWVASLILKIM